MIRSALVRFAATYTLLNVFNYGIWVLPFGRAIRHAQMETLHPFVRAFGAHVLGFDAVAVPAAGTGSSDTRYDWSFMGLAVVVSVLVALAWGLAARGRREGPALSAWLRTVVRYGLAGNMLAYGFVKILPIQFVPLSPETLARTFGESTPMGLLWAFMGFSRGYTVVAGLAEMLGGILLLRRKTLLGALVSSGVLLNVVALNHFYDVPVKLFSLHVLAASLYLLWPHRRRLAGFLWAQRAVPAAAPTLAPWPAPLERWRAPAKALVVATIVGTTVVTPWRDEASRSPGVTAAVAGVYDRLPRGGDAIPAGAAARLTIDSRGTMVLWGARASLARYTLDPLAHGGFAARAENAAGGAEVRVHDGGETIEVHGLATSADPISFGRRNLPLTAHTFRWVSDGPRR